MWQLKVLHPGVFGVGLLVALLTGPVQAAPLHYSESVSGDLTQTPSTDLQFDIGNNTISGTTRFLSFIEPEPNCHFCADFDSFAFNLPAHTSLSNISLSWDVDTSNVSKAGSDFMLCTGSGDAASCLASALGSRSVDWLGTSPLVVDFDGSLPIGGGTYAVRNTSIGIAQLDPTQGVGMGWTADYKWTFRVTPIPEPSSLALAAMAFGAFGLASLRRRN